MNIKYPIVLLEIKDKTIGNKHMVGFDFGQVRCKDGVYGHLICRSYIELGDHGGPLDMPFVPDADIISKTYLMGDPKDALPFVDLGDQGGSEDEKLC